MPDASSVAGAAGTGGALTPEIWTITGVGLALATFGTVGFTLLWRYIAAAEKRAEERSAAVEKRAEERSAAVEKRAEERSAAVERRAEARMIELKTELADFRTELKTDVGDLRTELKTDVGDLRTELKTDIGDLRTELKTDIGNLRTELKTDIEDAKADLKADIRMIVDRMERNHADLRHAIDTLILNDQAKRLTILEEAVLRAARPPDDREAQH